MQKLQEQMVNCWSAGLIDTIKLSFWFMWLPSTRGDTSNLSNSTYTQSYSSFKTQESDAAEYLKQKFQEICSNSSKLVWRAIWFRHRSCVLNVFKLLELEFANSWMVWRRTLETLKSRIWFKELQIEFERCKKRHFLECLKQRSHPCESQQEL